jgi:nucleoside-diphosphate-sugar epimerase
MALGEEVIPLNRSVVDLLDLEATRNFLKGKRPNLVIDAAAKVGGIGANNSKPVEFLSDNLRIQNNLMQAAFEAEVEKFVFLGSSCIYPRDCAQPIKEEFLMTGPLEQTNSAYAIAKISGIEMINSYRKEYELPWISLMPTNLYGPGDNFNLEDSHVFPALIRRFHEAKLANAPEVVIWGTGTPKREFLHVDDMAAACVFLLKLPKDIYAARTEPMLSHINVGTGCDVSIADLAQTIALVTGFKGSISFDSTKPDGTPRKLLDVSRLTNMGWQASISLEEGIRQTYDWYLANLESLREA